MKKNYWYLLAIISFLAITPLQAMQFYETEEGNLILQIESPQDALRVGQVFGLEKPSVESTSEANTSSNSKSEEETTTTPPNVPRTRFCSCTIQIDCFCA